MGESSGGSSRFGVVWRALDALDSQGESGSSELSAAISKARMKSSGMQGAPVIFIFMYEG